MAENLRTATYANGEPIANVTDNTAWMQLITGAWCHYENNTTNDAIYGKLYNWYTTADPRGLCPAGWHVPTDEEWTVLTDYLGGVSVAGGKMNSTTGWDAPNTGASNESGFSGLPGGDRGWGGGGIFGNIGNFGSWWSSTQDGTNYAWNRDLAKNNGNAIRDSYDKQFGFSVRCLRD